MHEFKVKFYLRPEPNRKCGHRTVQVRIYLDHCRDYLTSTKIAVPEHVWDGTMEKVTLDNAEGSLMNHRLDYLRKLITGIYQQHENDANLSLELIKTAYLNQEKSTSSNLGVCRFFRQYLKENEEVLKADNYRRYAQVQNLFGRYLNFVYRVKDIGFEDIYHGMLQGFELYLREQIGYSNPRTLSNKICLLKNLFGAAKELGMIGTDPFEGYVSSNSKAAGTDSLAIDDIKRLKKFKFETNRLDKVRDCFLFACYTGLSYQEAKPLTRENLTKLNDGLWILLDGPKNGMARYIPLMPYAISIIRKYEKEETDATLLPFISHQKTNQYLKEIAQQCHINKQLTFQVAVRSFTKIALSAGVSPETITNILGRDISSSHPLARISPEKIEEEMLAFAQKMGRDPPTGD